MMTLVYKLSHQGLHTALVGGFVPRPEFSDEYLCSQKGFMLTPDEVSSIVVSKSLQISPLMFQVFNHSL